MSTRIKTIFNGVAAALAALAARNSGAVPLTDWQFLLPALASFTSLGAANGLFGVLKAFLTSDGQAAALSLAAKLYPYQEKMLPQPARDAIFNGLRYRFAGNTVAVDMIDKLTVIDMQMSDQGISPADRETPSQRERTNG